MLILVALGLLPLLACGGSPLKDTVVPGSTTTPAYPGPPATRGPKTITFGPITFHTPPEWDIYTREPAATTAYIGELRGGPDNVELRVMTAYTGTLDALQPTECLEAPYEKPANVEVVESGFAPVGSLTAEYRRWRFTCPEHRFVVEEHGAWLLPVSHIAIVEQRHTPVVIDVVTTAEVA